MHAGRDRIEFVLGHGRAGALRICKGGDMVS